MELVLKPGEKGVLLSTNGPAILEELVIQVKWPADTSVVARNRMLRAMTLRAFWNGNANPSIEAPLGDFFLNGLRPVQYASIPFSHSEGRYLCRLPMPFERSVRLELENGGARDVAFNVSTRVRRLNGWRPDLRYLHASWRSSVQTGVQHTIVSTRGSGHYVGCYLVIIGTDGRWNILEGDESMFVDGETSASFRGTGVEDYFNGGWYYGKGIYATPLAGVLERSAIRASQYRFHLPDPIAFDSSFVMNMEFGHGNFSGGYMSSVAYWYLDEPQVTPDRLPPVGQRYPPADPVEKASMMCAVMEVERKGRLGEAADLSREYAERYRGTAEGEAMALRAIAYREVTEGFAAVRADYARAVERTKHEMVRRQAEALMKFHESPRNALLFTHINGQYKLFLDGVPVLDGDSLVDLHAASVELKPGRHVIAGVVKWVRPDNWFTVHLRTHTLDLWTDTTWKSARRPTGKWYALDYDDSAWIPCGSRYFLPKMAHFFFRPNAFVLAQHHELMGPGEPWNAVGETVFFRKEFVVK